MNKFLIPSLMWVFSNSSLAAPVIQKEWLKCKSDKDCVIEGYACGEPYAINRKFQEEFQKSVGPGPFDCSDPPPRMLYTTVCRKLECVVVHPKK